jgi:hypothetical protein
MVKVAILLTGQLRTWKLCRNLVDKLKDIYNVDIFMSINRNNILQNEHKNSNIDTEIKEIIEAIDYYKPIDYSILENYNETEFIKNINKHKTIYTPINDINMIKYFNENEELIFDKLYSTDGCIKHTSDESTNVYKLLGEQYYTVFKAYEMLEKYINKTNILYDIIIRLRFDQFIWNNDCIDEYNLDFKDNNIIYNNANIDRCKNTHINIILDHGDYNTINVFGGGYYKNYAYINDQFWSHKADLIEKMKLFYIDMPNIINKCKDVFYPEYGCWIEHFLCNYIIQNNINIKRSCLKGVFVRQKV